MSRPLVLVLAALLASPVLVALATTRADPAPAPATFLVGAAVRDITPATPQYLGGYGTDRVSDGVDGALQVRAFAVSNASGSTVMWAEVDTQGYFSGYQEGPFGTLDVRQTVARDTGVPETHIVVASSHSHAAPTIMGIWGPTDSAYLRLVHDQAVAALEAAYAARESARLYVGHGDASDMIGHAIGYGDMMPGWPADGTLSVLRAVGTDGHEVADFVNFGVHADIVAKKETSPDWLGPARDYVQQRLGGVTVVAEGTLGRQEAPIEDDRGGDPYQQIVRFGDLLGARAMRTLAAAQPLTSDVVDGDLEYFVVPATNPALLALDLGVTPRGTPAQGVVDNYPIDRSILPPFAIPPAFGSWTGALRFGDEVLFTLPGEAMPEVAHAIRAHLQAPAGADGCHGDFDLGLANDQLGYYWMSWETPYTATVGDFLIYDVNPALGDIVSKMDLVAAEKLGCGVDLAPDRPQPYAASGPGVQALAFPDAAVPGQVVTFEAMPDGGGSQVAWSFSDGATASGERVLHAFAATGAYTYTASVAFGATTVQWTGTVRVLDAPVASVAQSTTGGVTTLTAGLVGASSAPLQAVWSFSDATTATGLTVTHPAGDTAHVAVADASGLVATADIVVG